MPDIKIRLIRTQKILSPTQISLADYVINPYRGCEFGCLYCYAQENKNSRNNGFFNTLGVKINAAEVLKRQLYYIRPKRVLLGSTTECFQYQESRYKITEQILHVLNAQQVPYTILTKSHLIKEYLPLIREHKKNKVYFTLNCASDETVRLLEKKSPSVSERLIAIKAVLQQDIALRVHIGPFIPYLSSLKDILRLLPENVQEVDIELYHHKMGNFDALLKAIEHTCGTQLKNTLASLYARQENYLRFAQELQNEITHIASQDKRIFFYIIPDFNKFYSPAIGYEQPITTAGYSKKI
ncbi:MAG: radical SAM protein [Candidatus Omnitrophota bacterium]